jgi:hypothetical protein
MQWLEKFKDKNQVSSLATLSQKPLDMILFKILLPNMHTVMAVFVDLEIFLKPPCAAFCSEIFEAS